MYIIPEQFTVKAHPVLFEGEGEPKNEALLVCYSSLQLAYTFKTCTKYYSNIQLTYTFKTRLALCAFILYTEL